MDERNNHSRSDAVCGVTCAFAGASLVFVLLSAFSRVFTVREIAAYGWFLLASWILGLGTSVSVCYATRYGLGLHQDEILTAWMSVLGRANYVFSLLYNPALMAQKTAILYLYLNIMSSNDICRWFTIATIVVVNVGGAMLTLLRAFRCHSPSATLDFMSASGVGKCISLLTIYLASAPLNIITAIVILIIPMPILTSLRLSQTQKAAIIIVFGVGIFVAAVDVVRIAYLERASLSLLQSIFQQSKDRHSMTPTDDFTWFASYSYMCTQAIDPTTFSRRPGVEEIVEDNDGSDGGSEKEISWQKFFSPDGKTRSGSLHIEVKPPEPVMSTTHLDDPWNMKWNNAYSDSPLSPAFTSEPFVEPVLTRTSTRRSLTDLSMQQSFWQCIAISVLFLIWGFEYGVLSVLNDVFQKAAYLTSGQITALHSAYYAGYLVGPLTVGYPALKRWDFKTCGVAGLAIYACGSLVFWPAAVLNSFPVYFISNFIAGFGLSNVEVAADTLILLCGPEKYAELRLCLGQGVQAVVIVVAPLILKKAFDGNVSPANTLVQTQWA